LEVALCGPVNAGKSSLFNRLIGSERALVAEDPGTTRDFVEARVVWNGIGVTLIDTAGRREAQSEVEERGIELGRRRAGQADVEVHLVAADSLGEAPGRTGDEPRVVRVVSKGDRLGAGVTAPYLVTSAVTGQGLEALIEAVLAVATAGGLADEGGVLLTSERQRAAVMRAAGGFERAADAVGSNMSEEIAAMEARDAVEALAEVLGERVGDEVLDDLFARFCIGK